MWWKISLFVLVILIAPRCGTLDQNAVGDRTRPALPAGTILRSGEPAYLSLPDGRSSTPAPEIQKSLPEDEAPVDEPTSPAEEKLWWREFHADEWFT